MGFKNIKILKSSKGQSTVEYILLLAVIVAICVSVLKSDFFKNLTSKDGSFMKKFKAKLEWNYRYALPMPEGFNGTLPNKDTGGAHPSYVSGGETRFFGPADPYPKSE